MEEENKNASVISGFLGKIKLHWFILAAGFLMAGLVSLPTIAFPFLAGEDYRGINIAHFGGDAHYYLMRGKEVLEGNKLGSIVLRENKDGKDPTFSYAEKVMLFPVRALGLEDKFTIVQIYNFYDFVGVFALILLIYMFTFGLSASRIVSAAAALFVVGGVFNCL